MRTTLIAVSLALAACAGPGTDVYAFDDVDPPREADAPDARAMPAADASAYMAPEQPDAALEPPDTSAWIWEPGPLPGCGPFPACPRPVAR